MIKYTPRLDKAIKTAAWAHNQKPQYRKGTDIPYIVHPIGVMLIAKEVTDDEDILIACLLHDVLEDVDSKDYSESNMRSEFGSRVVEIVKGVTKDGSIEGWKERSDAYLGHLEKQASDESVIVSCSDKIHNLLSILNDYDDMHEKVWDKFNSSKGQQQWFYREVLEIVKRRMPDLKLIETLDELVNEIEKL